jgi:site-specific recombinase XerD
MNKDNLELRDLILFFDTYNRSEGKSTSTVRWYRQSLNTFVRWLDKTGRPTRLGEVDEHTIREFILSLKEHTVRGRPIQAISVNNRVRALRAFFNWLYIQGYTETHRLQHLRPPRYPKTMVDTLTDGEVAAIMSVLDRSTAAGSRNTAMLALLFDSGLRLSELAGLKAADVHIDEQYVKVMGKGAKERMVSFGNATRYALLHYSIHFRGEPAHAGIEEFFLAPDGYALTNEAVKSALRRIGGAAGVPRLHAHLCRHTYATNFLITGGNVLLLKQNLGHTTLAMVDRYVHLAMSKAAVLSRDFSPLDRMNIRGLRRGRRRNNGH